MVIVCYRSADIDSLVTIVERIQTSSKDAGILLRTPNPSITPNPANLPNGIPGKELPGSSLASFAEQIIALGRRTGCPVVDHYNGWLADDTPYSGPKESNPNKLWMRMSDCIHPGPLGHLIFFREIAPYFDLPQKLPWE